MQQAAKYNEDSLNIYMEGSEGRRDGTRSLPGLWGRLNSIPFPTVQPTYTRHEDL